MTKDKKMTEEDEPVMCEKSVIGVIKLQEILRNITLIKHYNFEKSYPDERIYLCADHIEQELQKLRYSNNHILETEWE